MRSSGTSPCVPSSFSPVPQGPLRRLLPANGLPPQALAADTLLNDFRLLPRQGRCCKVLQLLLLLSNSFYPLQGNLSTAIFNTHLSLCFNFFSSVLIFSKKKKKLEDKYFFFFCPLRCLELVIFRAWKTSCAREVLDILEREVPALCSGPLL